MIVASAFPARADGVYSWVRAMESLSRDSEHHIVTDRASALQICDRFRVERVHVDEIELQRRPRLDRDEMSRATGPTVGVNPLYLPAGRAEMSRVTFLSSDHGRFLAELSG